MPATNVLVMGTLPALDGFAPATVTFTLNEPLVNAGQSVARSESAQSTPVSASAGTVALTVPANDDGATQPQDSYYEVQVTTGGRVLSSIALVVRSALAPQTTLSALPVQLVSSGGGATRYAWNKGALYVIKQVLHQNGQDEVILLDPSLGSFTLLLPPAAGASDHSLHAVPGSNNVVTLATRLGQTVDGAASTTVGSTTSGATWSNLELTSDGQNWYSFGASAQIAVSGGQLTNVDGGAS